MFFMITYGTLNLATLYESIARNPSYRPRFRFSHWTTALLGSIGCFSVMFLISSTWAVVAIVIMASIYWYIKQCQITARWGDARTEWAFERARRNLLKLQEDRYYSKNWRPHILALSGRQRGRLAISGHWLASGRGILTLAQITVGDVEELLPHQVAQEKVLSSYISDLHLHAFPTAIAAESVSMGIKALVQCHGLGSIRPNTIGWS